MTTPVDALSLVTPLPTPSDSDIAAWQSLPRDEQLRRLQETLNQPECGEVSQATMSDILRRAQAAAKSHRG